MNLFHAPWLGTGTADRSRFASRTSRDRRPASWRRARIAASALQTRHALSERAARVPAEGQPKQD